MLGEIPPLQSMVSCFVVFLSKYVSAFLAEGAKKGNVWTRHACNPSTLQAEVGGSEVLGQWVSTFQTLRPFSTVPMLW